MKKLAAIMLIAFYGLVSLGLRATLHTCCGEVTGFGLVEVEHACNHAVEAPVCHEGHSACCEAKAHEPQKPVCNKEKKCCGEEELFILFDEVQTQPKEQSLVPVIAVLTSWHTTSVLDRSVISDKKLFPPRVNDPPPVGIPIYLMCSSLIVYG